MLCFVLQNARRLHCILIIQNLSHFNFRIFGTVVIVVQRNGFTFDFIGFETIPMIGKSKTRKERMRVIKG
jgi:hypothetical protein